MSEQTLSMAHNHLSNEQQDFALYPDPLSYSFNGLQELSAESHAYSFTGEQERYRLPTGFAPNTTFPDAPPFSLESSDLYNATSNFSTASGPSIASSVMSSPHSFSGHGAPVPEWSPLGLAMNPSIVQYDTFGQGHDYNIISGMDDFALDLYPNKSNFVGECTSISRNHQHASRSSSASAFFTLGPRVPSAMNTTPVTPERLRITPREGTLHSSMSSFSSPPVWPKVSQTYDENFPSCPSNQRSYTSALNSTALVNSRYEQSHFISQSSDPSVLHPQYTVRSDLTIQNTDVPMYQTHIYPTSPALSPNSARSPHPQAGSQSPCLDTYYTSNPYPPPMHRRCSVEISHHSYNSQDGNFSSEESREKGRCTYPECGKVFKDLKAHMLTHQNERPEKCPIQTCDYHIKGFARKYDKNRHTLTHYKGTMVCGFCPGPGSAAEKSFNRADVFKRHLTSVHAVEQTPPHSRKKASDPAEDSKTLSTYAPDATGNCSTCSATFGNAQDFYEHLDDCVLRIVQQEEPSEAINAARLAEVENDLDVQETLIRNSLPTTTTKASSADDDEDDEGMDDDNEDDIMFRYSLKRDRVNRNPANGVQKSRGMTHSKGGVTLSTKGRKKRKNYPSSWGCQPAQMKMKKRVLTVFDGPRRLWKDDMMLNTDYEVRMKLGDDKAYVTDLDVQTLRRADAFHNASTEEKGPWITDDFTGVDLEKLMDVESEL